MTWGGVMDDRGWCHGRHGVVSWMTRGGVMDEKGWCHG